MATEPNAGKDVAAPARLPSVRGFVPQLGHMVVLAATLALSVAVALWAIKPGFVPLFPELSAYDSAEVADALRVQGIPYEIERSSGSVLVPSDRVRDAKVALAGVGLPQNTATGLEMLQRDQKLGTSQFMESARYQHALEIELSRTISAMRNVDTARLHLAVPKQSVFVRKRTKPSASVMVKLYPGRTLEDGQAVAIMHLVASSVPYLESSQVTIVDQWGRLLTPQGRDGELGDTVRHFKYARTLEDTYVRRIESLLTPILGEGRVKAQVHADIDFSVNERTEELFAPDAAQVRSEEVRNQRTSDAGAGAQGVPGALTNQPPGAGTTQEAGDEAQAGAGAINSTSSTTRNYELDKTVSHTRIVPGAVTRLSVAVIVDDRVSVNEAGESVRNPLEQEELDAIGQLVREAVGFNEQRGDTVVVSNKAFQEIPLIEAPPDPPVWEQPWVWSLAKQFFGAAVVLFVLFSIVRPSVRALLPSPAVSAVVEPDAIAGVEDDEDAVEGQVAEDKLSLSHASDGVLPAPPRVYGDILNMARAMAEEDPKRVATVVKGWLQSDV